MGRRRAAGLLLISALALHNLEEGLAYSLMRGRVAAMLHHLGLGWWSPAPEMFALVLTLLTLSVGALVGWAATGATSGIKIGVLRAVAALLLINVALPHLPAAAVLGGYAPGVLTSLLVNLPVSLWVLYRLRESAQPG
ncbi:HXXEE domain-containing protein [Phenylobacterium sp.]|uniref:HXXEE domain-containing protein n=1 Tax=Phenylobacterium sp. TaxID=1871053 RepID=UPI0028A08D34|nr:HXXEE domain-containing protein [Phenylobacterium sp.]